MAWEHGFHNSVNGDRKYNADQISGMFEGMVTAGVYPSSGNKLVVHPSGGLTVQIATGRGWFNRRWVNNTSEYQIELAEPDIMLNRYAAVCVRADNSDDVRAVLPYIKYSEFSANPVKPEMERTDLVKEYCLAYVLIRAGTSQITDGDIEDTRDNPDLCGWAAGLIGSGGGGGGNSAETTVTLQADMWTALEGRYEQKVIVDGMTKTKSVIIEAHPDTKNVYTENIIRAVEQYYNTLTFAADTLPGSDVRVKVLQMGK